MLPERIQIKFLLNNTPDLDQIIPIFHQWIQDSAVDGLPLDVVDYKHVVDGPGVLLIGHEADVSVETADGRPGIAYKHKRDWPLEASDLASRLNYVLSKGYDRYLLLVSEQAVWQSAGPVLTDLEIVFPDRLNVPNQDGIYHSVAESVQMVISRFFQIEDFELGQISTDPRKMLGISVALKWVQQPVDLELAPIN